MVVIRKNARQEADPSSSQRPAVTYRALILLLVQHSIVSPGYRHDTVLEYRQSDEQSQEKEIKQHPKKNLLRLDRKKERKRKETTCQQTKLKNR